VSDSGKIAKEVTDEAIPLNVKIVNQPEKKEEKNYEEAPEYHNWKITDEEIEEIEVE